MKPARWWVATLAILVLPTLGCGTSGTQATDVTTPSAAPVDQAQPTFTPSRVVFPSPPPTTVPTPEPPAPPPTARATAPTATLSPGPTAVAVPEPVPPPLPALVVERAFPNLDFRRLTNLVQPDDGRDLIFVTEQEGLVRVFPDRQNADEARVFLDITERVSEANNEEGLLGLAFDPAYADNGRLFVYYSAGGPRRSVVSRFTMGPDDPPRADPASEMVIMEIAQPFGNHNGGQIAFGPDGYLYVALGDGGSGGDPQGNGQDRRTLLGSILRIDVSRSAPEETYRVPDDNPFVGEPGVRPEIWAYGLRNPWRFSFDESGRLWLADVGQNEWEEIDVIGRGGNYGWNCMEGLHRFEWGSACDANALTAPVWEYTRSGGNCSVTGGFVYRGGAMPSLAGTYVYGDFCSGRIWGLRVSGDSVTEHALLVESGLSITSFGEDLEGNLYILSRNEGIYRLTANQ